MKKIKADASAPTLWVIVRDANGFKLVGVDYEIFAGKLYVFP